MILTPLLKLPKNGEDWGKLIVAKGFKKLPKIQNIAQSGYTDHWHLQNFKNPFLNCALPFLKYCQYLCFIIVKHVDGPEIVRPKI